MSTAYTTTDAAERREQRRLKILKNSEERLSAILSGSDGNGNRKAPAMDFVPSDDTNMDSNRKPDGPIFDNAASPSINYVAPQYAESVSRYRVYFYIMFGFIARCIVLADYLRQIFPLFLGLFIPIEFCYYYNKTPDTFPKHGYIVNLLLVGGWSERLVIAIGHALDITWEIGIDLITVMFSYVLATILHSLLSSSLTSFSYF